MSCYKLTLLLFLIFRISSGQASLLSKDFQCTGITNTNVSFTISIQNIESMQMVNVHTSGVSCDFTFDYAKFSDQSVTPGMEFHLKKASSCENVKNLKFMKNGFLAINYIPSESARILFAVGNQPLSCKMSSFKKHKLQNFISKNYR
jgi:hypothetical protein